MSFIKENIMSNRIYCVFMDDDGGYVAGLFDNIQAAKACYRYHSSYTPWVSIFPICTEIIDSEFKEPEDSEYQ